jgi:hypothetical protein
MHYIRCASNRMGSIWYSVRSVWPLFKQHWLEFPRVKSCRTMKPVAAMSLLHIWGSQDHMAFKYFTRRYDKVNDIGFRRLRREVCILTDALGSFYACVVTQIHETQLDPPMEVKDQQHLVHLSGEFKGAQQRWTVPEKIFSAIVDTYSAARTTWFQWLCRR